MIRIKVAIVLLFLLLGCQTSSERSQKKQRMLTISAASSLKKPLEEIQLLYPQANLNYNFASSGSLRHQIEQGAPVDVFISAAAKHLDILQEKQELIEGTRRDLLDNKMVLIQPRVPTSRHSDRAKISEFQDLTQEAIVTVAIGEPNSVPAGQYAKELLATLGLFERIQPKLVYGKNVRQVLTYVATGNADAGIVYYTEAKASDRVAIVAIASQEWHDPIIYPVAVVRGSSNPKAAQEFVQFLFTPPVQAIFSDYGFAIAP